MSMSDSPSSLKRVETSLGLFAQGQKAIIVDFNLNVNASESVSVDLSQFALQWPELVHLSTVTLCSALKIRQSL